MDREEIVEKIRKIEKKLRRKPSEEQIQQAAYSIEMMAELAVDIAGKEMIKRRNERRFKKKL